MREGSISGVPPLSVWLRDRTALLHRDSEVGLLPTGGVTGFGDVVRLVTAHQRVLADYAGLIDELLPIPGAGPLSSWRSAAESDLLAWGVAIAVAPPVRQRSPGLHEHLIGVRYVVEGARMGIRTLASQSAEVVSAGGELPSRLLRADPDAGPRWHAVRRWLDSAGHDRLDRERILGGAREAFASYRPVPTR